jgi:DNA-binding HxlR family transcriptional regulator
MPDEKQQQVIRPTAVRRTLAIFSDPWAFALLQECFFGAHRFDEFQRNLGVSRNVLTKRLKELVDEGVFVRRLYQTRPDRYEYRLTDAGRAMYPIFMSLHQWGEQWLEHEESAPQITFVHTTCGRETDPELVCNRCGRAIRAEDMAAVQVDPAPPVGHVCDETEREGR